MTPRICRKTGIVKQGSLLTGGIRLADLLLIGFMLLIAAVLLIGRSAFSHKGTAAIVTTPSKTFTLALSKDRELTLEGRNGIRVVLEVKEGRVRFKQSSCPDKICVHTGWLSKAGQSAACVPAGISIRVSGESSGVDAIAGKIVPRLTALFACKGGA